jgi:hypothetical protein
VFVVDDHSFERLACRPGQGTSVSNSVSSQNLSDGTVTTSYSQTYSADDTVTSTAKASSPSLFAKVIGINSFDATATATATVGSYTGVIPVTNAIGNGKSSFNVIGFAWFIISSSRSCSRGTPSRSAARA